MHRYTCLTGCTSLLSNHARKRVCVDAALVRQQVLVLSGVREKLRRVPGEHSNAKVRGDLDPRGEVHQVAVPESAESATLFMPASGQPCHDVPDQGDMMNQRSR